MYIPIFSCGPRASDIRRYQSRSPAERVASRCFSRAKAMNGGRPNGWFSPQQWEALLAEYDDRCGYCLRRFPPDELVPDHKTPLARGGKNCIANIVPACAHCNAQKGAKTEQEYLNWLAAREAEEEVA